MTEHFDVNRSLWDGWARIHAESAFYDVEAFRAGGSSLTEIEVGQVGDVAGRHLLHLQCHFGLDTLSWARKGAAVTGVDFSDEAIRLARELAGKTAIPARFVCANVYDVPRVVDQRFEIVFTSWGVLPWLPDLPAWARVVEAMLAPGGAFHLIEFHPFAAMLGDDGRSFRYPYFHSPSPHRATVKGSYADPAADFVHESREWAHSLSDVIEALIAAGLRIDAFREYPWSPYGCYPFLEAREPGRWRVRGATQALPLAFSIRASRPGES